MQPITIRTTDFPDLAKVGGWIRRDFGQALNSGVDVLIFRQSTERFVVVTSLCTHQGGVLGAPFENTVTCTRHGAVFSLLSDNLGQNIDGVQTSPIKSYRTSYDPTTSILEIFPHP